MAEYSNSNGWNMNSKLDAAWHYLEHVCGDVMSLLMNTLIRY